MKRFYSLLLFVVVTLGVFAQTSVKGKVIDASTEEPLIGVTLYDEVSGLGATTDFDGTFTLSINGKCKYMVSYIGYESQTIALSEKSKNVVIRLKEESIGLKDVVVTSSIAIARKTPVAVSTVSVQSIEQKLGTQEFPEILKSTPGIYATKQGGGYGDSKVNLRGFKSENLAVMINGVPVNDMEWGGVYWSNWAGLSDVTRSMQVQRGLGASKISSPSVGGSINIVTRSTDMAQGGNVSYSVGNNGYEKISFTASTGLLENGWAFTFLGAQTTGDGYIQGTDFEAYSWFVNISKRIGDNQTLSLTGFGAPQKHYQRSFYDGLSIENWQKDGTKYMGEGMDAYRYNPTYGFANGQRKTSAYNVYNKPQISLNHVWQINDISNLSTALYVSIGRGGGYSGKGQSAYSSSWYGSNNGSLNTEFRNSDGTFAYDKVYDLNEASTEGSQMVMTMSNNSHNWYGLLSTYETQLPYNLKASGGVDFRYYKGMHNNKIIDLYGGEYYTDNYYRSRVSTVNNSNALDPSYQYEKLGVGDVVYRDYIGYVMQEGVFGQLEGTYLEDGKLNAFVSAAVSNKDYWRVDKFYYDEDHEKSSTESHIGYNVKAGANYNINAYNNVFANIGVISRQPYFSNGVFVSSKDNHMVNPNSENEKIQSAEVGYGFKWQWVALNVNAYYTKWMDKTLVKSGGDFLNADGQADRYTVNMTGVDAIHKGIEFDANFHPTKWLSFNAMLSIGDWKWDGTAEGYFYNSSGQPLADSRGTLATAVGAADHAKMTLTQDDVPVGGSAQTTAALGMDVKLSKGLRFGVDYTYAGRNFADWSFNTNDLVMNGNKTVTPDVWEMPDYGTFDLNASYSFRISGLRSKLSANCNNVLNDTFIVDAMDGSGHDWQSAYRVFYGFGRTWSMRFKIYF